jgi:two-component system, OmpR family, alkaline phosphatase synthesis response regulator PhoP
MTYRLVLADDELHILRAAEFKLKRQGYDVVCANDGQEAWELVCQKTPDLLITDFQMPRLNGLELIKRLREQKEYAAIPVLMLTAKANELPQNEVASSLGNVQIIDKPFSPRDLCNRAQQVLDEAAKKKSSTN